jgi:hypothetical protein
MGGVPPRRPLLLLSLLLLVPAVRAADAPFDPVPVVEVAGMTTSIYIGSVSLDPVRFTRSGASYEGAYGARVFPYSFFNEHGSLRISVSDETLRRFRAGMPFAFAGRVIRSDGKQRKVEGRVVPTGPLWGKIHVRVYVTRRLPLDFDTTYRLPPTPGPRPSETR